MAHGRYRWVAWVFLGLVALVLLLSIDYRPAWKATAPTPAGELHARGALRVGAAKAELVPPFPVVLGGYSSNGGTPATDVLDKPCARALVVEAGGRRLALVSAEVVVVPRALRERVQALLDGAGLDAVHVLATHTHTGPGAYWDNWLASWTGLGSYDPRMEEFLAGRMAGAVREAAAALRPARLSVGRIEASNYAANRRRENGAVDTAMTAARFADAQGETIARLVHYAAHPTVLPRDGSQLSGDWPSWMATALEEGGSAPALFIQGAVGDVTWAKRHGNMTHQERVARLGRAIAADARGALAAGGEGVAEIALDAATVEVALPPGDARPLVWGPLVPIASNVLHRAAWPGRARVSFVRMGPLALALVPGEVVADLGLAWREEFGAAPVSLADDYLGYVETPERVRAKEGESRAVYFGPELASVLHEGLRAARDRALQAPAGPPGAPTVQGGSAADKTAAAPAP